MNVSRRGFLGSILGTYVTTKLPWFARKPEYIERVLKGEEPAHLHRLILVLENGLEIKGPQVAKVQTSGISDSIQFQGEALVIVKPFIAVASVLVGPNGTPLCRAEFPDGPHSFLKGNSLELIHHMSRRYNHEDNFLQVRSPGIFRPKDPLGW